MPFQPRFSQQRQRIRQQIRQRRRELTPEQQRLAAQQIAERVATHPRITAAQSVAAFLSFDGELDTAPLIERLWRSGKRVYLPVLHPFSPGHLLFLRYAPDTPLTPNRFNILEPQLDVRQVLPLGTLEVVLTPLVAFDDAGQRLGMGGGFYDRTLQNWQRGGPYPIGLAHDCQQVERLPIEHWDIPLPEILTPSHSWAWPGVE
ncbi:5-formyltetrahydrofolate cyclo-ligase [Serratia entomophila]|uniref:5-formyltetrahydrofolate cyclo-ligase n=1 Tax=Serratia entomophila TaxID=42906 RepID=UPI00217A3935|nr:5-formyltetrahydrofolate cyclo-ligase [Serratia entomophila]CAI1011277.1 5-formyltetrahydrofolate cyclo-ligase family protein [Serratia entomophila]CAI1549703.1 5-formyltetrahydrofolate cyclo-ligase family protein [Serratia entomophila]CAI1661709.1 5-formyltetrahydrofolate cyclo-ligase family protein [Serratia entomophila]CAI1717448.1 5-formyltetrahydrofolate cyclo-ligase family protein [Serratia entomophila]CAI1801890.1 5-formyltetrahydrofolate cyclo-ligase family protein [Serratia entomop